MKTRKHVIDDSTYNLLVKVQNIGATAERGAFVTTAATTAAAKGVVTGASKGFALGWNYAQIGVTK